MKEINLSPFYVGQKVIAIRNHTDLLFKTGETFIIKDIKIFCCGWVMNIDILVFNSCKSECSKCKKVRDGLYFSCTSFAPVQENFQSISLEKILEQETSLISAS